MAGLTPLVLPFALMLAGGDVTLQQTPTAPPAPEDAALTLAFQDLGERMTVPVQVAGAGPYRFIIDTGSQRTVISRELAGRLRLVSDRPVNIIAMSGVSRADTVVIPSLRVSEVSDEAIKAPALGATDIGALGLLGIDLLRGHKVDIDFDAREMTLRPSEKRRKPAPREPGEIVVRAKSLFGQLIVTQASFDDKPIRVIIDTGSPVSVGNHALRRLITRASHGRLSPLELTSATGGVVTTQYATVDKLRVGEITFQNIPVAFADVAPFKTFGVENRPAMLLGMSALKFFRRVQIDFANREVRFQMPRRDRMAAS